MDFSPRSHGSGTAASCRFAICCCDGDALPGGAAVRPGAGSAVLLIDRKAGVSTIASPCTPSVVLDNSLSMNYEERLGGTLLEAGPRAQGEENTSTRLPSGSPRVGHSRLRLGDRIQPRSLCEQGKAGCRGDRADRGRRPFGQHPSRGERGEEGPPRRLPEMAKRYVFPRRSAAINLARFEHAASSSKTCRRCRS